MEVIKKNVIFKFSEEDIKAIKRAYEIVNEMGDVMDEVNKFASIILDGSEFKTDDVCNEIWSFLFNLNTELSRSNTIEVFSDNEN